MLWFLSLLFFCANCSNVYYLTPPLQVPPTNEPRPAPSSLALPCAMSFISQGLGINLPAARNLFTCTCKYDKHTGNSTRYPAPDTTTYHLPPASGLAKGQVQLVLMLRSWGKLSHTARQQLQDNCNWNLPNYILKYYCSVPGMVLCVSPCSAIAHSPLQTIPPCLVQLRSANLTIFALPLTGDIWRSKLLSNYFVSCGNVAAPRIGDSLAWRLTGLAILAPCNLRPRRREIEKKLLVSFACVAGRLWQRSGRSADYGRKCVSRQIIDYMPMQSGSDKKAWLKARTTQQPNKYPSLCITEQLMLL